jgi:universal stress protein E
MHMRPIRRILVAISDPSASPLAAVAKGARIAKACHAHLELFHSIKASVFANNPAAYDEAVSDLHNTQRMQYLQRLGRIAARVRLHGVTVSTAVEYDYPAHEAIIRRAQTIGADLIIAGQSHGVHASPRLLKLIDWELLRHSPLPVLLVKHSHPYRHPTVLAAIDPGHTHAKPRELDQEILDAGLALAQPLGGKVHAVHAYAPIVVGSAASSVPETLATRLDGIARTEAKSLFEAALAGRDIPTTRRHLIGKSPDDAIEQVARRTRADIVVMGALSRSGLKRLFIGDTAERLLDVLPCDVLVVKPQQFVCRIPTRCNGPRLLARIA